MPAQPIRPSQYVLNFGPGSILEGPDGPRIVLSLEKSDVFGQESPSRFAVHEAGLSAILADHGSPLPVRLPTNAERLLPDSEPIYKTNPFPQWSLCVRHSRLYRHHFGSLRTGCPKCTTEHANKWEAARIARREAIRFVAACSAGHLDDVDWYRVVDHAPQCRGTSYIWEGGGGALRFITIRCDDCGGTGSLGLAYGREWPCSGNWPERGQRDDGCPQKARIVQRGAANLYTTELVTAVTIPRLDTRLHQSLAGTSVIGVLQTLQEFDALTAEQIRARVKKLTDTRRISPGIEEELSRYDDEMLVRAAQDVLSTALPATGEQARLNEFRELQRAATHGHPLQPTPSPGSSPLFEVVGGNVRRDIQGPGGLRLRVAPVSRLRVVMAQLGYRRTLSSQQGDIVPSTYTVGQEKWIPAVELLGEGIFIDLTPPDDAEGIEQHPTLQGRDVDAWSTSVQSTGDATHHPVFVWWHTLSHRLIRALGIDSGYSSAAVRERVYVRTRADGSATGGVLLYTAQPGGDGTLGGLIALVPNFERVVKAALRDVDACSNDPLCIDEHYRPGAANGAICYACGFISETSCEFRNMFLDRNVLLSRLP